MKQLLAYFWVLFLSRARQLLRIGVVLLVWLICWYIYYHNYYAPVQQQRQSWSRKIAVIKSQNAAIARALSSKDRGIYHADVMQGERYLSLIKVLANRYDGIRLITFLPYQREEIDMARMPSAAPAFLRGYYNATLNKQNVLLEIEGKYIDIYRYLSYIEKHYPTIHWDRLDMKMTQYPVMDVTVLLHTFLDN